MSRVLGFFVSTFVLEAPQGQDFVLEDNITGTKYLEFLVCVFVLFCQLDFVCRMLTRMRSIRLFGKMHLQNTCDASTGTAVAFN